MRVRTLLLAIGISAGCAQADAPSPPAGEAGDAREAQDSTLEASYTQDSFVISESGVGRIRLGMTLAEAQRALPSAVFVRTTDGDGAALIEVTIASDQRLTLWAEEEDADASIDWAKPVKRIEAFTPRFHTREGVYPGARVTEVEGVYGKTRMIEESEIESRQYIVFTEQPAYLTLRLDYTGIFREGQRTTTEFQPAAKIMSITVSSY